MGVNEIFIYYPDMETGQGRHLRGVRGRLRCIVHRRAALAWGPRAEALAKTGVLASLASGVQARTARG